MAGVYVPPLRLSVMALSAGAFKAGDAEVIRMDAEQEQAVAIRPT